MSSCKEIFDEAKFKICKVLNEHKHKENIENVKGHRR